MKPSPILFLAAVLSSAVSIHAQPDSLWSRTFGGGNGDWGASVQQTSDGRFVIAGVIEYVTLSSGAVCLIKTDNEGNEEWGCAFGGGGDRDEGSSVQQTEDGGFVIAGVKGYIFDEGSADVWLIKTDNEGNEEWNNAFGGESDDWGSSIQQTADGGFIVTGYTRSFGAGEEDVWLIKTDDEGNEEWNRTFGGESNDCGCRVQQTADGGFVVTGYTRSFGAGDEDVWLIKTDDEGNEEWNCTFGGENDDDGYSVQQTSDGGFVIAGRTRSFGAGSADVWLIKTDAQGREQWNRTFGGERDDGGNSVQQTADDGFVIAGLTESFGAGESDVWLVKTGPDPVSVPESDFIPHPSSLILSAYPNPFNSAAVASYELRIPGWANLSLYDTGGRLVRTLADGFTTAGTHRIHWSADGLPSGRYTIILGDDRRALDAKGVTLVK